MTDQSVRPAITAADRRLLDLLQSNGRISNQELADAAALSPSACWRRVRALEEAGVIERYMGVVNPAAVGLAFHATVHVELARHQVTHIDAFIEAVLARPEVMDCFATTGDADYYLRVRCKDLEAYNDFLERFLFGLEGVSNVRTNVILRQIKHEQRLDIS